MLLAAVLFGLGEAARWARFGCSNSFADAVRTVEIFLQLGFGESIQQQVGPWKISLPGMTLFELFAFD